MNMNQPVFTAKEQVIALIANATQGARIEMLRRRNTAEGFTCHSVGISGGCGQACPVFRAQECDHQNNIQSRHEQHKAEHIHVRAAH